MIFAMFLTWLFVTYVFYAQKIDGFLAVLSITGGNFSPQSQKLPFSVTSVDGDRYLLYYASIDLAKNSLLNKYRVQKSKLVSSNDESQMVKSRLQVPMKGRIQLVGCLVSLDIITIFVSINYMRRIYILL